MNRVSRAAWRGYLGLLFGAIAVLVIGASLLMRQPAPAPVEILPPATLALPPTVIPTSIPPVTPTAARVLRVDVAGAVRAPGVYRLSPDSIVADAIAAAGGPAPDADLDRLNKAVPLQDGMQVYVPHAGLPTPVSLLPATAPVAIPGRAAEAPGVTLQPVNVNSATQEELESLPGIGPAMAQRIIAARPYAQIEDLLRVKGIGPATFEKIRDLVTLW